MVPIANPGRLWFGCLLALTLLAPASWGVGARGPQPSVTIPLEPLGYEPLMTQFMLAGSSMLTVHFVDDQHILLTYNAKRLLKRLSDCPASDQDRIVAALLLEIPSGKVLAKTEWRVHDRGQYLWSLGRGRFLLRIRGTLSTFAPLANLASGEPFVTRQLVTTRRLIEGILLSPDADLMIIESKELKAANDETSSETGPLGTGPEQVDFFRVSLPERGDPVILRQAGRIYARGPGRIPANSAGYVAILDQGKQHWAFDFRAYSGKVQELAAFDSTCRPTPFLVSRSEFVVFGCHQSQTQQVIGGFNLRGEEMWEQNMGQTYLSPSFAFAPAGGRFAFSRVILHAPFAIDDPIQPELIGPQTVIVYQTDSGKQILRIDCSPIERAGQNFALSPDGLNFAVIRNDAIEVYGLPPLTPEEQKAVQLAKASAPAETDAPVNFEAPTPATATSTSQTAAAESSSQDSVAYRQLPSTPAQATEANDSSDSTVSSAESAKPAAEATAEPTPPPPAQAAAPAGDETPRKPPTLYTLPGESGATAPEAPPPAPQ